MDGIYLKEEFYILVNNCSGIFFIIPGVFMTYSKTFLDLHFLEK